MNLLGKIVITLSQRNHIVSKVELNNNREKNACQLLLAKSPQQALALLPKVFSLCATAQSVAGKFALSQICDDVPCPNMTVVQQQLTLEWLKDHNWQLLLVLNLLQLTDVNKQPIIDIHHKLTALEQQFSCASGDSTNFADEALASVIDDFSALFGCALDDFYEFDFASFLQWLKTNRAPYAQIFNCIFQRHWQQLGNTNFIKTDIDQIYQAPQALLFEKLNQVEQGCLARNKTHPLIEVSIAQLGSGALARLLSRLLEICELLVNQQLPEPVQVHKVNVNRALALVSASRGYLLHDVSVNAEQVVEYCIHAPTDTVFSPNSEICAALETLQGSDQTELLAKAQLLVACFDPCVDYKVELSDA